MGFGARPTGDEAILHRREPDDAIIHIDRLEGKLAVAPEWESQKGQFGYARRSIRVPERRRVCGDVQALPAICPGARV